VLGIAFIVGVAAAVACNLTARKGMKAERFNDRPGPRHLGS
jgi:hypothetical protein